MIRVRQIKVSVDNNTTESIENAIKKKLKANKINGYKINKQSLDARDKNNILYIYEIDVDIDNEKSYLNKSQDIIVTPDEEYKFESTGNKEYKNIVVVGSGPAGLFASYTLSKNGYKVTIIERGEEVDKRVETISKFWETNKLNPESNVQFGEGGAGTFSDGKLNTMVKDKNNRSKYILKTFTKFGAPDEILYSYKPHIGTDILRNVVKNMRNQIIDYGSEIRFNTKLTNIFKNENNELIAIEVNNNEIIECDVLVLAIGHSARDTFKMLHENNIEMESKPFAVGLRVEHPQELINISQYGEKYASILGPAPYKLTYQSSNKHGVYSFCMCPGGLVVNSSSEEGLLAINGMSNYKRDEENANSAIIATVDKSIYGKELFDGIKFQRELEKKAYELGNGFIPVQLLKDYIDNKESTEFKSVNPIYKGKTKFANLNNLLPEELNIAIKEAFIDYDKKIKGFNNLDAILAGIESRTSSPIKIIRDEELISNIKGIYPCGEGAGYAGGITSAAMDGIKVAEAIGMKYKK